MQVHIRHEAPLAELSRRFPAFAPLHTAQIAHLAHRRWQRAEGTRHSHDLQVVFLGKSGYGKSSLVNALCGVPAMATSDVAACTRVIQSVEYAIHPEHYLSLADLPGLGESQQRDREYLRLYREIIRKADVVVYALRADCRDYSIDLRAFAELFSASLAQQRVILAVNGCDKIEPLQRDNRSTPSEAQRLNIQRKLHALHTLFPRVAKVVPCSAATGWQLDRLGKAIIRVLRHDQSVQF